MIFWHSSISGFFVPQTTSVEIWIEHFSIHCLFVLLSTLSLHLSWVLLNLSFFLLPSRFTKTLLTRWFGAFCASTRREVISLIIYFFKWHLIKLFFKLKSGNMLLTPRNSAAAQRVLWFIFHRKFMSIFYSVLFNLFVARTEKKGDETKLLTSE